MKCVELTPTLLRGSVNIPPSKSLAHRAIICAALSKGESTIKNVQYSDDILATINGMRNFGCNIVKNKDSIRITGIGLSNCADLFSNNADNNSIKTIDCIESGSTLRFLIPISLAIGGEYVFKGKGNLVNRPLNPYYEIFKDKGIKYSNDNGKLPLKVCGKLKSGEYKVKGDISSQFISGLLFALPTLNGDSKIVITTKLESKKYVDLTIDVLSKFGIHIKNNDYNEFIIEGNQTYKSASYEVEGDFSQAAFFLASSLIGSSVSCRGLNLNSHQGDKIFIDIIKKMGANVKLEDDLSIRVVKSKTKGIDIDVSECPDLVPILAVVASLSSGTTRILNAGRLRIKECDRLCAITSELSKLGADIEELKDGLIINGKEMLYGGKVNSWNDHRIAMALSIASIRCKKNVVICGSECVKKSYPEFWNDFKKLGGKLHEQCIW